jgi:putative endonuclease
MKTYHVYILTNKNNTVLYTGITSDLDQRVFEHKTKLHPKSFTARYNCDKLVYFEEFDDVEIAIKREKQLKRYEKLWKKDLINKSNPEWKDLSEDWFDEKTIQLGIEINRMSSNQ